MANRIMRASLRVMATSRPVPPKPCAVEASACVNSSKSRKACGFEFAIPQALGVLADIAWSPKRH